MEFYAFFLILLECITAVNASPIPPNQTNLAGYGGVIDFDKAMKEQMKQANKERSDNQRVGDGISVDSYGSIDYDALENPSPSSYQGMGSIFEQFEPDASVDYENMEGPKSEKMIKDGDNDTFPETEVAFKQMHERARYMRMAEIKDSIISKLRLIAPPNMTEEQIQQKLSQFPQHLLPNINGDTSMQNDETDKSKEDFYAKISTVLQFTSDFPTDKDPDLFPVKDIAYFEVPLSVSERNLQKATLLLYVKTPVGKEGTIVQLTVTQTLHKKKPIVMRNVKLSPKGHWEHIDISEQVKDWIVHEEDNYGIICLAELKNVNLVQLGQSAVETAMEEEEYIEDIKTRPQRAPLIKMTLNENAGRHKRSDEEVPQSCDVEDKEKRCCRYKFVIDFDQMGSEFKFIIQPKRYLANYCAGTCPTYYLPSSLNEHMLMSFSRQKLQRCCTPKTMKPLEILYIDANGTVLTGILPDMTIEKCSCS